MQIKPVNKLNAAHYALLLTADPALGLVQQYVQNGQCFAMMAQGEVIGIFVWLPLHAQAIEIKNIAVRSDRQNQGVAQKMLTFAIDKAKKQAYRTMEIGTGTTSLQQLYLYQKMGFRFTEIWRDFFVTHYAQPIFENGLQLKDMVRLRLDLF